MAGGTAQHQRHGEDLAPAGSSRAHGCTRVRERAQKHRHERESEQTREGARLATTEVLT
jgi:hypothetical protein